LASPAGHPRDRTASRSGRSRRDESRLTFEFRFFGSTRNMLSGRNSTWRCRLSAKPHYRQSAVDPSVPAPSVFDRHPQQEVQP
jgi:hypothetical protein